MLFPIKSESRIRRLPIITLSLIGINIIIFIFTFPVILRDNNKINEAYNELVEYEYRMYIEHRADDKITNYDNYSPNIEAMREQIKNREFGLTEEEWEEWDLKYQKFNEVLQSRLTKKLGFTPSEFNFFKLITHLFLHAGIGHLLGNMWFLWLVGVNIEDEWGRPFFIGFYILSGIVASVIFALISQSNTPLIGASGAIAGVMGAFAVKYYKSKIYFLFFWLIPPIITTFPLYAGIVLPFWFLRELIYAFTLSGYSNVAFWAHVAGFGFGAILVIVLKYYGLEEKFIKPLVDETLNYIDTNFSKAVEARSLGDFETAEKLLNERLEKDPSEQKIAEELIDLYCSNERTEEAGNISREVLRELRKRNEDVDLILSFYEKDIKERNLVMALTTYDFYYVSSLYNMRKEHHDASRILVTAYKKYRETNDAPYILLRLLKALYKSKDKKFFKKALTELRIRFPEMEGKVKSMIMEEKDESKRGTLFD